MPPLRIVATLVALLNLSFSQEAQISGITGLDRPNRERATSSSGQFLIYGGDGKLRSQFSKECERVRKDLAAVLNLPQGWYYPVVVEIDTTPRQLVQRRTLVRAFPVEPQGFRFQLDVLHDENYDPADVRSAMVRLLVLEQMFYPPNRKISRDEIPAWVLAGLEELVIYHRSEVPSDVYASLIESHQIPPVREILTTEPGAASYSVSRRIYRACSAALVQALLDQGNGPMRFRVFLQDLAVEDASAIELLERHFAAMRQDHAGLQKWWALQMAAMSQKSAFEFLSVEESDQQLELALSVRFDTLPPPGEGRKSGSRLPNFRDLKRRFDSSSADFTEGSIRDFEQFLNHPRLGEALEATSERLGSIQSRVFPLYVPIIASYNRTMLLILEGKTREVQSRLESLDRQRAQIRSLMTQITDHMNWYDATQVDEESDAFDSYERALKDVEKLERRKRTDPISRYLDTMEREFGG